MEDSIGIELLSGQSSNYKGAENSQPQCRELIQLTKQVIQRDNSQVTNYTILPAVNLCPLTCDISNLETVQSDAIEFKETPAPSAANSTRSGRKRCRPRSYSPSEVVSSSKRFVVTKLRKKPTRTSIKGSALPVEVYIDQRTGERFSCDMCQSPYIVNPEKCNPGNRKRPPVPRKHVDPASGKIMLLCNACGIAVKTRPKMKMSKRAVDPSIVQIQEQRYLAESKNLSKKLSRDYNEPALATIYCPSFGRKGCYCIQKYLSLSPDKTSEEIKNTVLELLSFQRKSRELRECPEADFHTDDCSEKLLVGFRNKCRSKEFEKYVLSARSQLKTKYSLCERATQKVLLYSNNFLHKKNKCSPKGDSRVEKQTRRIAHFKPISEIHKVQCCRHKCSAIAITHSVLLENWREKALVGHKGAWKVIAEMLTPTGGTKANCYRFIRLITGSCSATIASVSEHMKKTKGDRSPPEHGLKKYWSLREKPYGASEYVSVSDEKLLTDLSAIPSEEELMCMEKEVASTLLLQKRQQLESLHNKLRKAELYFESVINSDMPGECSPAEQGVRNKLSQDRVNLSAKSAQRSVEMVAPGNEFGFVYLCAVQKPK